MEIKPQAGPQEMFLSSPADIAIYGGAAGGGKTYALPLECLRHVGNPKFGVVIFRRKAARKFRFATCNTTRMFIRGRGVRFR